MAGPQRRHIPSRTRASGRFRRASAASFSRAAPRLAARRRRAQLGPSAGRLGQGPGGNRRLGANQGQVFGLDGGPIGDQQPFHPLAQVGLRLIGVFLSTDLVWFFATGFQISNLKSQIKSQILSFIPHPSSFRLHPSALILPPSSFRHPRPATATQTTYRRDDGWAVDLGGKLCDNSGMGILGHVQNGVVVFDCPTALPEGAAVTVLLRAGPVIRVAKNQKQVEFPLVPSSAPGSVHLTNEMIAEILDEEDASS